MIVQAKSSFTADRTAGFVEAGDVRMLQGSGSASLMVEPPGRMVMPVCHVANRREDEYRVHQPMYADPDGKFPSRLDFPAMMITKLENAFCLPHAPPILLSPRRIVTDFQIPWGHHSLAWFTHTDGDAYDVNVDLDTERLEFALESAFYLDHALSTHYGHFIGDCLCRIYALDVCRALFADMPVLIADGAVSAFQAWFLQAAGVPARNIIKFKGLVHCRHLLLATQALGIQRYTSPAAARLWGTLRDRGSVRDVSLPDRLYISRRGVNHRILVNEADVERVFARNGFAIIHPESLPVKLQVALFANALLVAGPGGSGLFNLAFQGRMRSAFILRWEEFLQLPEMLLSAERDCNLWFHLGHGVAPESLGAAGDSWAVDIARLESDVSDWLRSNGV
jgi:hypothetical protein